MTVETRTAAPRVRAAAAPPLQPKIASIFIIVIYCLCFSPNESSQIEPVDITSDDEAAQAATPCVGDEGLVGRCVPPHLCFSTNPYIEGIVQPPECTMQNMSAVARKGEGEGGALGVCCTDCDLVANASNAVLDGRGEIFWKTGDKSFDKCIEWLQRLKYFCHYWSYLEREVTERRRQSAPPSGTNVTEAVAAGPLGADDKHVCHAYTRHGIAPVGGEDVVRGEYPHMVLLGYRDSHSPLDWLCSGALVSERFVLTAAHCLHSHLGPVTEVALGVLRRSDPPEYWHRYQLARLIPHPEYHPPSKYNDIALLETELPVQFKDNIRPACLPARVLPDDYAANDVTAAGWGALGHRRPLADTLQKVHIELISEAECSAQYPAHRHLSVGIDHSAQMCYGHRKEARDTCAGDSGGALQRDTRRPSCAATLLGVTSFGRECGTGPTNTTGRDKSASAGVYVRVQHYLPWIESIVWA